MNFATLFVAALVAVAFVAIVAGAVRNWKKGKSTCACSGNCSSCGHCPH